MTLNPVCKTVWRKYLTHRKEPIAQISFFLSDDLFYSTTRYLDLSISQPYFAFSRVYAHLITLSQPFREFFEVAKFLENKLEVYNFSRIFGLFRENKCI